MQERSVAEAQHCRVAEFQNCRIEESMKRIAAVAQSCRIVELQERIIAELQKRRVTEAQRRIIFGGWCAGALARLLENLSVVPQRELRIGMKSAGRCPTRRCVAVVLADALALAC